MKIPKYEKDRTLTRRTVKGAAGGMKGVDYEDDRRADPSTRLSPQAERLKKAKAEQLRAGRQEAAATARAETAHGGPKVDTHRQAPKEEQEMILDDEDAMSRDAKARQRRRTIVSRDRLTVDKNAPDHRREVPWDLLSDDEQAEPDEATVDVDAIVDGAFSRQISRAHLFATKASVAPGAPGLLMPEDIQTAFPSPIDYAKHCMLLAEAYAQSTGAYREETVRYMAALFMGLPDVGFARRALMAWGPDTGIVDIYPLEVIEHILLARPDFLPRVRFERWIVPVGEVATAALNVDPTERLLLHVPEDVMVRGFAIRGGLRPGYCFEPGPSPATYALTLDRPGRFTILTSARSDHGYTLVDRLEVCVNGEPHAEPEARPRDQARVAAWPMPAVPDRFASIPFDEQTESDRSSQDLAARRRLDALRGPKGDGADSAYARAPESTREPIRVGAEPVPGPIIPLEAPGDVQLSIAEAAVLRLALAAGATMSDVQVIRADGPNSEEVTDIVSAWPDTAIEPAYQGPPRLGQASTEDFVQAEADRVSPGPNEDGLAASKRTGHPPKAAMSFDATENTIADAPAVVGRPDGVVSGTQTSVPSETGPAHTSEVHDDESTPTDPRHEAATERPSQPKDHE